MDLFLTLCKWGGQGSSGVHGNSVIQLMRTVIHKMDCMEVARCSVYYCDGILVLSPIFYVAL